MSDNRAALWGSSSRQTVSFPLHVLLVPPAGTSQPLGTSLPSPSFSSGKAAWDKTAAGQETAEPVSKARNGGQRHGGRWAGRAVASRRGLADALSQRHQASLALRGSPVLGTEQFVCTLIPFPLQTGARFKIKYNLDYSNLI